MAKYKCKCCGFVFDESEIVLKDGEDRCPNDGSKDIESLVAKRMVLSFHGHTLEWHKDGQFGRDDFRMSEQYKWVSSPQFSLKKKDDGWVAIGEKNVVNPTFLDGQNIEGMEKQINENSEIFIGNKTSKVGLQIKLKFIK